MHTLTSFLTRRKAGVTLSITVLSSMSLGASATAAGTTAATAMTPRAARITAAPARPPISTGSIAGTPRIGTHSTDARSLDIDAMRDTTRTPGVDATRTTVNSAITSSPFFFDDGGWARSYTFRINTERPADTALFFYGGSGCPDWGVVMPDYVRGFTRAADVYVMNKRHASLNVLDSPCSLRFAKRNNPGQWAADFSAFISTTLASRRTAPRHVVLVGVSEGAVNAVRVARALPAVTHLALIGEGGFSMRRALATLADRGALPFDPNIELAKVNHHPESLTREVLGSPNLLWNQILDDDPMPDFMALTIPVILGMGQRDESVPVESAEYLEEQFRVAGKTNLTRLTYPGADHRLQAGALSYRPAFFKAVSDMLD